jgi:SAM-dependent methyltransferase
MRALARNQVFPLQLPAASRGTAHAAYDEAGDKYLAYADGDARQIYAFDGHCSFADRSLWSVLDAKLMALRESGRLSLTILDAGCGPGTWIRRLVIRARALGFTCIRARGFDMAEAQIRRARHLARGLQDLAGVEIAFDVGDITRPFQEGPGSVDLTLCLYAVLNHLKSEDLALVMGEIGRVTSGHFVTTVRAAGSPPTIYVDGIEHARQFRQDNNADRFDVELDDGRRMTFQSRLFTAQELRDSVGAHLEIETLRGLDLFHARFAHDPRWTPDWLADNHRFREALARLEEQYASNPDFIDHATHLLLVARSPANA